MGSRIAASLVVIVTGIVAYGLMFSNLVNVLMAMSVYTATIAVVVVRYGR